MFLWFKRLIDANTIDISQSRYGFGYETTSNNVVARIIDSHYLIKGARFRGEFILADVGTTPVYIVGMVIDKSKYSVVLDMSQVSADGTVLKVANDEYLADSINVVWNNPSSGGGSGLTPEQEAKLNAIILNGTGDTYLSSDGTYKSVAGVSFTTYPTMGGFPATGEDGKLYLDASTGNLYYWDGLAYHVIDEGLFSDYVTLTTDQSITGLKEFDVIKVNNIQAENNSEITIESPYLHAQFDFNVTLEGSSPSSKINLYTPTVELSGNLIPQNTNFSNLGSSDMYFNRGYITNLYLNDSTVPLDPLTYTVASDGITPVLQLKPGTKIASASLADSTSHEILGVNTYTTPKTFDQTEIGSQEALFNVNIVYDADLTQGHATADVYNEDGSYRGKEVFVYVSDLVPQRVSVSGITTTITVPINANVQSVNYNRVLLFSDDYTVSSTTVTITNPDIVGNMTASDRIEVTYYI